MLYSPSGRKGHNNINVDYIEIEFKANTKIYAAQTSAKTSTNKEVGRYSIPFFIYFIFVEKGKKTQRHTRPHVIFLKGKNNKFGGLFKKKKKIEIDIYRDTGVRRGDKSLEFRSVFFFFGVSKTRKKRYATRRRRRKAISASGFGPSLPAAVASTCVYTYTYACACVHMVRH